MNPDNTPRSALHDALQSGLHGRQAQHEALLKRALSQIAGNRPWRKWKTRAAEDLITMADRAARMDVMDLDVKGDLQAVYRIRMPVPRWPMDGKLQIGEEAAFHLGYQEQWLWESPAGWAPLGLLFPPDPFHPEARPALRGALCLGHLQPGTRPTEIVLMGYYMLTLQDLQLDDLDPAGVLNVQACEFYRNHGREYVPLTRAGLFEELEPRKESS